MVDEPESETSSSTEEHEKKEKKKRKQTPKPKRKTRRKHVRSNYREPLQVFGRPTLLVPEVTDKIINLVRGGNFPETAAAAAGIARPTLIAWTNEGNRLRREKDDHKLPDPTVRQRKLIDFVTALDIAMGEADARDVLMIGKHAEKDWKAAAWRLERRNRKWAPFHQVEQTNLNTNVEVVPGAKDTSAREWVLEKLRRLSEAQKTES